MIYKDYLNELLLLSYELEQCHLKLKLTPNWQMEKEGLWGKYYSKATYPEREKQEVPTI